MKQTILFLDNTYPKSYQSSTLSASALGGTEASVIRTANILSKHYNVIVAQKYRQETILESQTLSFIPKSELQKYNPNYIVVLRKYPLLKKLRKMFPTTKLFLWLHTYKNYEFLFKRFGLHKTKTTIICNSKTHKQQMHQLVTKGVLNRLISVFINPTPISYCYNPIPKPKESFGAKLTRDKNKLLFFSSPNKGLTQTLNCFKQLLKHNQHLKLYIANPGYKFDSLEVDKNLKDSIVILGSLKHEEMMQHVKESLCIFYPQDTFSETFGLIYAEANAYGTPVLGHDIGSAREILHEKNILVDVNDIKQIKYIISLWQNKLPLVSYNEKFSDEYVLNQWLSLHPL